MKYIYLPNRKMGKTMAEFVSQCAPQKVQSRRHGEIEVMAMWQDNGVIVVKVVGGPAVKAIKLMGGATCSFLYWRLAPYPERVATREDLCKAIGYKPHLDEALIWLENQDIPNLDKVLSVREKILRSAGVSQ